jgi:hypothetical protein
MDAATTEPQTQDENVEAVKTLIGYCFLVNAGAIIALLTFLGRRWGLPPVSGDAQLLLDPFTIKRAIGWFAAGMVTATLTSLVCAVSEAARRGWFFVGASVAAVAFCIGLTLSSGMLVDGVIGGWSPEGWDPGSWTPGSWSSSDQLPQETPQ